MNITSKLRFPKIFDESIFRLVSSVVVAALFFVAFVFSYALPASAASVSWEFYSIGGIFAITALILAMLVFDKELR
jgi:hypothetical protein